MGDKITVSTYTKVVMERKSGALLVECRHCRGTGQKYPSYGKKNSKRKHKCPTCGGNGVNRIEISSDEKVYKCRHCRGTGQKYPGYGGKNSKRKHKCPTCKGKGVLTLKSPRIECRHCRGTGQKYPDYGKKNSKRKHKCPTCNGVGSNYQGSV